MRQVPTWTLRELADALCERTAEVSPKLQELIVVLLQLILDAGSRPQVNATALVRIGAVVRWCGAVVVTDSNSESVQSVQSVEAVHEHVS